MSEDPYEHARRPTEASDASVRVIAFTAGCIALLVCAGLVFGAILGGLRSSDRRLQGKELFTVGSREVPDVVAEWPAIDHEVREHLETYGWVDRKAGIVRIPIAQAMKRLAQPSTPP